MMVMIDVQRAAESHEHMTRTSSARNCLFRDGQRQIGQYRSTRPVVLRLHDTTGWQTGCTTGFTTGWMLVYTMQPVVQPVVYRVHKHSTGCETGLTTGMKTGYIV